MANVKVIEKKAEVVSEIKNNIENAKSVVLFDYRGLTDSEIKELRNKLRDNNASYKVYKNTLTKRAMNELNIDFAEYLSGPSAISFGSDELSIVKVISDFSKEHDKLVLKAGIVDGKITTVDDLKQYASIPSRDGLLTMLAAGMMETIRDLSICLDLYSKEK
jgi:large subunit ribosomal protein L10